MEKFTDTDDKPIVDLPLIKGPSMFGNKIVKQFISLAILILLTITAWLIIFFKPNTETAYINTPIIIPDENTTMILASPAFENNKFIPIKYTCDGLNIHPPLRLAQIPENTVSLAIIAEEINTITDQSIALWLVWNIETTTSEIEENILPNKSIIGKNDFGENSWHGPCPTKNQTNQYYRLTLYALNTKLNLTTNANINNLMSDITGHIIAKKELIGLYER